jgi:cytochrome c6
MARSVTAPSLALFIAATLLLTPSSPARADDGASLYKAKCASCHGADGSGNTPAGKSLKVSDLSSAAVQKSTDADLTQKIADGKGKMPAYAKKLTPDQIKSLVATIRAMAAGKQGS